MDRQCEQLYNSNMQEQYSFIPVDSQDLNTPKTKKKYKKPPRFSFDDRQDIAKELATRAVLYERSNIERDRNKGTALRREAERFCQCGFAFKVYECEYDANKFMVPLSCHSRICENCSGMYYRKVVKSVEQTLKPYFEKKIKGFGVYLVTLTVNTARYDGMPDRKDIERFYSESAKFFRLFYGKYKAKFNKKGEVIEDQTRTEWIHRADGTKYKKKRKPSYRVGKNGKQVEEWRRFRGCGYIASVEIGSSNNLHCHAIVYAPYISQQKLSETWLKITGDSFIVGIESVNHHQKAAWYVLKYIMKPPKTNSHDELCDYLEFIKGTRRIRAGGVFYGRIKKLEKEVLEFCCPYCSGRLGQSGTTNDKDQFEFLYPLLQARNKRGSPLPPPGGKPLLGSFERNLIKIQAMNKENITWLE